MSETKWTPGPWKNHGRIEGAPGPEHSAVAAYTLLARVYSTAFGDTENQDANATLIAAAPELYEALLTLAHCTIATTSSEWDAAWKKADKALAKARGKQP